MKARFFVILWTLCAAFAPQSQAQSAVPTDTKAPLRLVQAIPLPSVEGYFDHMAVDIKGQRLFVPGEHQRTIEVIDLRTGKDIHTITGFGGDPRKTLYLPETNEIWVDDGDATVKSFSGETYELTREHLAELEAFNVVRVTEPQRYFLLVQSDDELLDWRKAVAFYGGAWQSLQGGGDHAFQHFEAQIAPILRFSGIADS